VPTLEEIGFYKITEGLLELQKHAVNGPAVLVYSDDLGTLAHRHTSSRRVLNDLSAPKHC
jgi:hypothetical protein